MKINKSGKAHKVDGWPMFNNEISTHLCVAPQKLKDKAGTIVAIAKTHHEKTKTNNELILLKQELCFCEDKWLTQKRAL